MRLQEIHPAVVHFPLALLPAAVATDGLGRALGDEALMTAGRRLTAGAAASAIVSAAAGLVAQPAVAAEGEAHDLLVTHRNINLVLAAGAVVLAVRRMRSRRPSIGQLAAGALGVAAMTFTAALGGKMVYEHGVGVKAAGGLKEERAPQVTLANLPAAVGQSAANLGEAVRHGAEHVLKGEIAPSLLATAASQRQS